MENNIVQVREQWGQVIQAVVAACGGNQEAGKPLAAFLTQMEQKDDWRTLVGVLRRILAGERDALTLLRGLDETDTLVAGEVLRGLGVDVPLAGADDDDDDDKMVSLDQFIQNVIVACKPGAPDGLAMQLHRATMGMAMQPNLQPELREFGRVLSQVLAGERNPDLSALHPQLAEAVRGVLQAIES